MVLLLLAPTLILNLADQMDVSHAQEQQSCLLNLREIASSESTSQNVEAKVRSVGIQLYREIEEAANSVEERLRDYRLGIGQERFPFEIFFEVDSKSQEDMPIDFFDQFAPQQGADENQIDLSDIDAQALQSKAFFLHFEHRARSVGLQDRITVTLKADSFLARIGFYSTLKDFQTLYRALLDRPIFNEYGEKLIVTASSLSKAIYEWDRVGGYEGQWQKQNHYLIKLMSLYEKGKSFEQIADFMNEEFAWVDAFKRGKWTPNSVRAMIEERLDRIKREQAAGFKTTLVDEPLR